MSSINPELTLTLDDAVAEVLGLLTGQDLTYDPEFDRYRVITRCLNRALRSNALEHEWSYYSGTSSAGTAAEGMAAVTLPATMRPRINGDDAVRLVNGDDQIMVWAYFLPREALHKYGGRPEGLWVSSTKNYLLFSRKLYAGEAGLDIQVPVMREPNMFRLPPPPEDPSDPVVAVDPAIRAQPIDFCYPDIVTLRAAFYYAQTDPVMQPRVQTLEAQYKDLMYQIIERDDRNTDSPYLNEFFVPVQNDISGDSMPHLHPHSDGRRW